jgi:hypothetical protein
VWEGDGFVRIERALGWRWGNGWLIESVGDRQIKKDVWYLLNAFLQSWLPSKELRTQVLSSAALSLSMNQTSIAIIRIKR